MTDPITEAVARAFTAAHGTPQEDARELAEVAIRALYGALEREGWQVVPHQLSNDMWFAVAQVIDHCPIEQSWNLVWEQFLAAAPKPPGRI